MRTRWTYGHNDHSNTDSSQKQTQTEDESSFLLSTWIRGKRRSEEAILGEA